MVLALSARTEPVQHWPWYILSWEVCFSFFRCFFSLGLICPFRDPLFFLSFMSFSERAFGPFPGKLRLGSFCKFQIPGFYPAFLLSFFYVFFVFPKCDLCPLLWFFPFISSFSFRIDLRSCMNTQGCGTESTAAVLSSVPRSLNFPHPPWFMFHFFPWPVKLCGGTLEVKWPQVPHGLVVVSGKKVGLFLSFPGL